MANNKTKEFKCEICDIELSSKGHLKEHMDSVHNQNGASFQCKQCDKQFSMNSLLTSHIKTL